MRIFSNFDTKLEEKLLKEYAEGFGVGQVMSIHRSRFYYYHHVVMPYVLRLVIVGIAIYPVYMLEYEYQEYAIYAFWAIALIYLIVVARMAGKAYVDYTMDFLIVTPKEIVKYNQDGVLHRETENIPASKIKTISVKKDGFINSFFDIGSIVFLAEWNDDKWDIVMEFIDAVEQTEKKIKHVLGLDRR